MAERGNTVELIFRAINESGSVINQVIQQQQKVGQAAQQAAVVQKAWIAQITPEFIPLQVVRRIDGAAQLQEHSLPPRVGRNEPCPCGSGKKFKKCYGTERGVAQ